MVREKKVYRTAYSIIKDLSKYRRLNICFAGEKSKFEYIQLGRTGGKRVKNEKDSKEKEKFIYEDNDTKSSTFRLEFRYVDFMNSKVVRQFLIAHSICDDGEVDELFEASDIWSQIRWRLTEIVLEVFPNGPGHNQRACSHRQEERRDLDKRKIIKRFQVLIKCIKLSGRCYPALLSHRDEGIKIDSAETIIEIINRKIEQVRTIGNPMNIVNPSREVYNFSDTNNNFLSEGSELESEGLRSSGWLSLEQADLYQGDGNNFYNDVNNEK